MSDCMDCGKKGTHIGVFVPRDPKLPAVVMHRCDTEGCIVARWDEKAIHPVSDILKAWDRRNDVLEEMRDRKDGAYLERNQVVAVFARLALAHGFRAGITKTAIEGWSPDWHNCVYIDLPAGQVSWHYHDDHAPLFHGLPEYTAPYDGHTTPAKYDRLNVSRFHGDVKPRAERSRETEPYLEA